MPALWLTVLADAGRSVRYLTGRAVWQASAVYRGGEAKTDAKDARIIADQSRIRGEDLPVLHPDDDLIAELRMLTAHRADLVADRTRTINRLRQQLVAVCPALERAAVLTQDRGWVVLLARYQRPKAIRQSGGSRLTRVLADSGVRNAAAIAAAGASRAADTFTKPCRDNLESGPIQCAGDGSQLCDHVLAISALFDHRDHSGELPLCTPQSVQYRGNAVLITDHGIFLFLSCA
jgi:hypothetical protein